MYVAYHSVKVMGGDLEVPEDEIYFITRKSEKFLGSTSAPPPYNPHPPIPLLKLDSGQSA